MRRTAFSILALGIACLAAPAAAVGAASPNLIANGSFEQPVVAAGSYVLLSKGQSFPGWKVDGAAGNVAPISGSYGRSGLAFVARTGKQWLDLTGLTNRRTGILQTVRSSPGARYLLRFWVGNVVDRGGGFGVTSTVLVLVDGRRVMAARNTAGAGARAQAWRQFTVPITARSRTTTIAFLNGDAPTDNSNGLDGVSLVRR